MKKKSHIIALLLVLFFGPMGLLYIHAKAAFGVIVGIAVLGGLGAVLGDAGFLFIALAVILLFSPLILAPVFVSRHNNKVDESRHSELMDAAAKRDNPE